jgi:DnaK suppressor protein
MTETTQARYREILLAKLRELHSARGRSEGIAVVRTADNLGEAGHKFDRGLSIVSLNRESIAERGIAIGLRRIRQGTFGSCVNCGDEIGRRRLDAVPWTPLCIDCQRAGEAGTLDDAHAFFPDAA